jgi:hypothetical protein
MLFKQKKLNSSRLYTLYYRVIGVKDIGCLHG